MPKPKKKLKYACPHCHKPIARKGNLSRHMAQDESCIAIREEAASQQQTALTQLLPTNEGVNHELVHNGHVADGGNIPEEREDYIPFPADDPDNHTMSSPNDADGDDANQEDGGETTNDRNPLSRDEMLAMVADLAFGTIVPPPSPNIEDSLIPSEIECDEDSTADDPPWSYDRSKNRTLAPSAHQNRSIDIPSSVLTTGAMISTNVDLTTPVNQTENADSMTDAAQPDTTAGDEDPLDVPAEGDPVLKYIIPPLCAIDNARSSTVEENGIVHVSQDFPTLWEDRINPTPGNSVDVSLLRLLSLLESIDAPQRAFRSVLDWLDVLQTEGLIVKTSKADRLRKMHRKTYIKSLIKKFGITRFEVHYIPVENKYTKNILNGRVWFIDHDSRAEHEQNIQDKYITDHRGSAIVPKTDFLVQVRSLLISYRLMGDISRLGVNCEDIPRSLFLPVKNPRSPMKDVTDGSWYADTVRRMKLGPNDFLLPIIIYLDKTGTDVYNRKGLEPVIFTLGIFDYHLRQQAIAWRPLAFIPDQELMSKAEKLGLRQGQMKGTSNRNYQRCLRVCLSEIVACQSTGFDHFLMIGEYAKNVRIYPKVSFVMGDGKSGDSISGRYTVHTPQVRRQCRACWTMFPDLDNHDVKCNWIRSYQTHFPSCQAYSDGFAISESAINDGQHQPVLMEADSAESNDEQSSSSIESDHSRESDSSSEHREVVTKKKFISLSRRRYQQKQRRLNMNKQPPAPNEQSTKSKKKLSKHINSVSSNDSFLFDKPFFDHRYLMSKYFDRDNTNLNEHDQFEKRMMARVWEKFVEHVPDAETARKILKSQSQHETIVAFQEIDFGGDIYGINGCSPTDPMHAVKLGIIKYAVEHIVNLLKKSERIVVDGLAHSVILEQRQIEKRFFPRTDFSHSLTSITQLTADEWVGVLFCLVVVLRMDGGETAFLKSKPCLPDGTGLTDIIYVCEMLLCFNEWIRSGPFWPQNDTNAETNCLKSIRTMMGTITKHIPRDYGCGWKLSKFHEMLHLPFSITRFGPPRSFDAGTGERLLKTFAKKPAKGAQQQTYNQFLQTCCLRCSESATLADACDSWGVTLDPIDDNNEHESFDPLLDEAAHATTDTDPPQQPEPANHPMDVLRHRQWGAILTIDCQSFHFKIACSPGLHLPPSNAILGKISSHIVSVVRNCLSACDLQDGSFVSLQITGYSEAVLWDRYKDKQRPPGLNASRHDFIRKNGLLLRCHNNYRRSDGWHDWVVLDTNDTPLNDMLDRQEPSVLHEDHCLGKIMTLFSWKITSIPKKRSHLSDQIVDAFANNCHRSHAILSQFEDEQHCAVIFPATQCGFEGNHDGSVITEDWFLQFVEDPDNQEEVYLPLLVVVPCENVVDRALVFCEIANIVDGLRAKDLGKRERVVHVIDRESHWASNFY